MATSAPLAPHSLISPLPTKLSAHRYSSPPSSVKFRPMRIASATTTAENTISPDTYLFSPSSSSSFYQVLGIPMGASDQEIKAAYRRLARTCHPDVAAVGRKNSSSSAAADEFIKIHAAYLILSDPVKRADYDRRIFRLHRSRSFVTEAVLSRFTGGYIGRNWETDQCW